MTIIFKYKFKEFGCPYQYQKWKKILFQYDESGCPYRYDEDVPIRYVKLAVLGKSFQTYFSSIYWCGGD